MVLDKTNQLIGKVVRKFNASHLRVVLLNSRDVRVNLAMKR